MANAMIYSARINDTNLFTGSFGGMASSLAILPFMSILGMVRIPTGVIIPSVQKALNENGEPTEENIAGRVEKLVSELKWYAEALNVKKLNCPPPS